MLTADYAHHRSLASVRPEAMTAVAESALSLPSLPPMPSLARVSRSYAMTAWQTARLAGVPVDTLKALMGTDVTAGGGAGDGTTDAADVSVKQYLDLLDQCSKHLSDPVFGLRVGLGMGLSTYAGYGLVLCTCADFGAVARATQRYESLAHDLGRSHIEVSGDQACYRWDCPWLAHPGGRHLAESVMAGILTFVRWLAGETPAPLQISFTHGAPDARETSAAKAMRHAAWGDARVEYGSAQTQASFPAVWLEKPVKHYDPTHAGLLVRQAELQLQLLSRRGPGPVSRAVYDLVCTRLATGEVSLPSLAGHLGMGARRLQRKLAQEGMAFSQVVLSARQTMARGLLLDPTRTLTEVAFSLGFNQSSSFNHAFRAWFGVSPAQWRASHLKTVQSIL